MATVQAKRETFKDRWRKAWPVLLGTLAYMIPLFWLWSQTEYPESFGFRIAAHGKAGIIESWWYSYLLAKRHHFWDVVTFIYMWAAVAGIAVWVVGLVRQDRRDKTADGAVAEMREGDAK